jgi:hypothetical protein
MEHCCVAHADPEGTRRKLLSLFHLCNQAHLCLGKALRKQAAPQGFSQVVSFLQKKNSTISSLTRCSMKTCYLLAMSLILLLSLGCSNGFFGNPSQDQAWSVSNASIVMVYNCRMLPPDNSWDKDISPSPYPDSTRNIASIFNGQARRPSLHIGRDYGIPFQTAGSRPERPLITLVMRGENSRVRS